MKRLFKVLTLATLAIGITSMTTYAVVVSFITPVDTPSALLEFFDGNDTFTLGDGSDTLFGWWTNDVIAMGDGNDTVVFGAGDDLIALWRGDDSIVMGAGKDTISFEDTALSNVDKILMGPGTNAIFMSDDAVFTPGIDGIFNTPSSTGEGDDALLIRGDAIELISNHQDIVIRIGNGS